MGKLDYGDGEPITVLSHIAPILFPCVNCASLSLHVVGEQPYGPSVGFGIPFMKPLLKVSLKKGYHLICNTCTTIAGQVAKDAVAKLEQRTIPTEICAVYTRMELAVEPYTLGFIEEYLPRFGELDSDTSEYLKTVLAVYRRET